LAGRVPEHVIQQIVRSVDLVRLFGRYCDLKKKGKKFWALCPFHKEKTPSFSIDPESGLYYCFGCKEGGNVFTFLQAMDGLSFGEALKKLAAEAGVDLSRYRSEDGPSRDELAKVREVNELATSFYSRCLEKAGGAEVARQFLERREINARAVETWRLGFAPEGWDHFLKCATGRGYGPDVLVKAGLVLPRQDGQGYYDRFRFRLMFPIADAGGRTIGFGARALKPDDEPKYLNSPETPLFRKGSCFFGLSQAKEAIRSGKTAVVLEGYTDVIMAHQCGVPECVAVLGTALTEEHGRRLSRLCERVILVFDPDEAGRKSAKRSIEVLLDGDLEIRVTRLPEGKDPCDFLVEYGGEEFRKRLDGSQGFFEYRLALARQEHDTSTVEGQTAAFRDVAEVALAVKDQARRDIIVRRIARELGMRERSAWAYLQQASRATRGGRDGTAARATDQARLSARESLPGEMLGLLLCQPEFIPEVAGRVELKLLRECAERDLLGELLGRAQKGLPVDVDGFVNAIGDPALARVAASIIEEEKAREERITTATTRQRLDDYMAYLEELRLASAAPPAGDDEQLKDYVRRLKEKDKRSARTGQVQEP